ncbi:F0F1 ATP synthase subunit epsilon [Aliiglaciecola sp. LCG003]|uniref:F0F1 ATP synthase subunit epsilon n=1 Tax=Aliiglaciecola sp. LCG003 TaxID=3053655 RepID=UPI00257224DA|nr:F0F1 ATP synthase subunit epsilon [Aliiglaciecola sp. LCG003]WJG07698.1 F0F1 ATP synthase subunit epsilon [Aliiglaciecola sp. LCG003]
MELKVLLPGKVFCQQHNVTRAVVETIQGSFGILPHRRDCAAALEPGILTYQVAGKTESYIAIDQGVVVKTGNSISISVRRAVKGDDLRVLQSTLKAEFLSLSAKDREIRFALEKLESRFVQRLTEISAQ